MQNIVVWICFTFLLANGDYLFANVAKIRKNSKTTLATTPTTTPLNAKAFLDSLWNSSRYSWKETAPDVLVYQNSVKVRRCTCDEIDVCQMSAIDNLDVCKEKCAIHLKWLGAENADDCFTDFVNELEVLEKCARRATSTSCSNELAYIDAPNFSNSSQRNPSRIEAEASSYNGTVLIKMAKKLFVQFRTYQKCVFNCAKERVFECHRNIKCAIAMPSVEEISKIFQVCSPQMQVNKHFNAACRCLTIPPNNNKKLRTVCPYLLYKHVMAKF